MKIYFSIYVMFKLMKLIWLKIKWNDLGLEYAIFKLMSYLINVFGKNIAERGFDPPTFELWAQRDTTTPPC